MKAYKKSIYWILVVCLGIIMFVAYSYSDFSVKKQSEITAFQALLENLSIGILTSSLVALLTTVVLYFHEKDKLINNIYLNLLGIYQQLFFAQVQSSKCYQVIFDETFFKDRRHGENIAIGIELGWQKRKAINVFEYDGFFKKSKIGLILLSINRFLFSVDTVRNLSENLKIQYKNLEILSLEKQILESNKQDFSEKEKLIEIQKKVIICIVSQIDSELVVINQYLEDKLIMLNDCYKFKMKWEETKKSIMQSVLTSNQHVNSVQK